MQDFHRGDGVADVKGSIIKIRVVIYFMHGIKRGLTHALYADICQRDITVLYLMLEWLQSTFMLLQFLTKLLLSRIAPTTASPPLGKQFVTRFTDSGIIKWRYSQLISIRCTRSVGGSCQDISTDNHRGALL